jgi:MFS family permease
MRLTIIVYFYKMVKIFRHLLPLFVVQFFTWLGLFALWIYATPVITRYVFATTDSESTSFENGTTWVGICFAFYSTLAALLAFLLPAITKHISKEKLHSIALFAGAFGLIMIWFIRNKYLLFFSFAFIGIAWSSISTIPYSIISSIAPEEKVTTYFAVFNFSVVIPQVTAAFLLGYLNKNLFEGETIYVIVTGGCSMFIAAIIMFFVKNEVHQPE